MSGVYKFELLAIVEVENVVILASLLFAAIFLSRAVSTVAKFSLVSGLSLHYLDLLFSFGTGVDNSVVEHQ